MAKNLRFEGKQFDQSEKKQERVLKIPEKTLPLHED